MQLVAVLSLLKVYFISSHEPARLQMTGRERERSYSSVSRGTGAVAIMT